MSQTEGRPFVGTHHLVLCLIVGMYRTITPNQTEQSYWMLCLYSAVDFVNVVLNFTAERAVNIGPRQLGGPGQ